MLPAEDANLGILVEFDCLYLEDQNVGRVRPLGDYQRRFAGYEAAIAAEYEHLRAATSPESAARELGGYRVRRVLGRGGMGVVYAAEDVELGREVAIKVLSSAWSWDPLAERRFELEIHALGQLRHPGIVTIHRSGRAAEGARYFAMELIDGVDLASFLRRTDVDLRTRVRLIRDVCAAVAYAHQNGVIHRDLKPSNVLVTWDGYPGDPEATHARVKVVDFGLARCARDRADGATLTGSAVWLGTIAYMAPERLEDASDRADVRSDVYALGVVLFEVLTRERAFGGGDPLEIARRVRTTESLRPRRIRRELPADLDAIVAKATANDPERRYQTANALMEDVDRFLAGRAVAAHPPSVVYAARKWVVRNKAGAGAALLVLLSIAAFGLQQWRHGRAIVAERDATRSLLMVAWQTIAEANPNLTGRRDAGELQRLKRLAEQVSDSPIPPLERAALLNIAGKSLLAYDEVELAGAYLERALEIRARELGPNAPATLTTAGIIVTIRWRQGRLEEAERSARSIVDAIPHAEPGDGLASLRFNAFTDLASVLARQGSAEAMGEAEDTIRRALSIGVVEDGSLALFGARRLLAELLLRKPDGASHREAQSLMEESLDDLVPRLSPDVPALASARYVLARALTRQDEWEAAEPLARESRDRLLATCGLSVPDARDALLLTFGCLWEQDRAAEAVAEGRRLLEARVAAGDPRAYLVRTYLGHSLHLSGSPAEGVLALREGYEELIREVRTDSQSAQTVRSWIEEAEAAARGP